MSQHFLLSAAARTLSLKEIYRGGEDKAYTMFRELRWHKTEGAPVCPRCGGIDAYEITTRRKFKCKACSHQFSVTSGTIFASRKMAFSDMLAAICITVNAAKGISMLQLARDWSASCGRYGVGHVWLELSRTGNPASILRQPGCGT